MKAAVSGDRGLLPTGHEPEDERHARHGQNRFSHAESGRHQNGRARLPTADLQHPFAHLQQRQSFELMHRLRE
jgi:hypothetical protein